MWTFTSAFNQLISADKNNILCKLYHKFEQSWPIIKLLKMVLQKRLTLLIDPTFVIVCGISFHINAHVMWYCTHLIFIPSTLNDHQLWHLFCNSLKGILVFVNFFLRKSFTFRKYHTLCLFYIEWQLVGLKPFRHFILFSIK